MQEQVMSGRYRNKLAFCENLEAINNSNMGQSSHKVEKLSKNQLDHPLENQLATQDQKIQPTASRASSNKDKKISIPSDKCKERRPIPCNRNRKRCFFKDVCSTGFPNLNK